MKQQVKLYYKTGYELIKKGASDNGLATYVALMSLYNEHNEECDTTIDTINYILTGEFKLSKDDNRIKTIKNSLIELDELNVIEILECDKRRYILDLSNLYQETKIEIEVQKESPFDDSMVTEKETVRNYFSYFELSDIRQALKDNGNKKAIFRYLFYMFNQRELWYFNKERNDIAQESGFDIRTIDKYNEILVNNHILYIYKYDYKYTSTGKTLLNAYGVYTDRQKIDEECIKFIKKGIANNEIYESKTYANKGNNTKQYKQELAERNQGNNVEKKKVKAFGRREPKIVAFVVESNFADDAIMNEPEQNTKEQVMRDKDNKKQEYMDRKMYIYDWRADMNIPQKTQKETIDIAELF